MDKKANEISIKEPEEILITETKNDFQKNFVFN